MSREKTLLAIGWILLIAFGCIFMTMEKVAC